MRRLSNINVFTLLAVLAASVAIVMGTQQFGVASKPWPSYSQQNMPHTSFMCRGKILGGYYADAETQCQMFHVCVKVAGVGVQDFRFLCPNGTAFDQEAQTCADWGDVDCEQATLYYGSDNFDLYRIGSGFESKRAPLLDDDIGKLKKAGGPNGGGDGGGNKRNGDAVTSSYLTDDEEPTFHLQRAESNDARRSKSTFVGGTHQPQHQHQQQQQQQHQQQPSKSAPTKTNIYTGDKTFDNNRQHNNLHQQQPQQHQQQHYNAKPAITTTSTPTTSTSTTTTTVRPATNFVNRYAAADSPASVPRSHPLASSTTTTSTTTTSTTRRPSPAVYNAVRTPAVKSPSFAAVDREIDDIFKGSHSSNFFNNRNGKDDEYEDVIKTSFKPISSTTSRNSLAHQQRGRGNRGRIHYKPEPNGDYNGLEGQSSSSSSSVPTPRVGQRLATSTPTAITQSATTTAAPQFHQRISNYQKTSQQQQPTKIERFNFQSYQGEQQQSRVETTTLANSNKLKPSEPFGQNYNNHNFNVVQRVSTERNVQSTTRQDPFKVTYNNHNNGPQLNRQADNFNFELNRAFESQQPQFQQPHQQPRTTSRPLTTTTTQTSTQRSTTSRPTTIATTVATTRRPINTFAAFNNNLQSTVNNEEFIDVFKVKPSPPFSPNQPLSASVFNIFGTANAKKQPAAAAALNTNFVSTAALIGSDEPTKLQRDNFNNLERTVHQLQNSVNRAFGHNEPRTLLSQFSIAPPGPTTYNPHHYTQRQPTATSTTTSTTPAPIVTSSPRGFAATATAGNQQTQFNSVNANAVSAGQPSSNGRFPSRGSSENYTPSSVKRFSTLVPRDQYNPTTFKPNANQQHNEGTSKLFLQEAQHIVNRNSHHSNGNSKYLNTINFAQPSTTTTTTTTTTASTTTYVNPYVFTTTPAPYTTTSTSHIPAFHVRQPVATQAPSFQQQYQPVIATTTTAAANQPTRHPPLAEDEEDDGQYRPELYEQDFARNKLKRLREQQNQKQQLQQHQQQQQYQPSFASSTASNSNHNQASSSLRAQQNSNQIIANGGAVSQPRPFDIHNSNNNDNFNHHGTSNNHVNSAEDELLNTAHSQNIAASRNELQRNLLSAQKKAATVAAPTVQQPAQQHQPQRHQLQQTQHAKQASTKKAPTIPPKAATATAAKNSKHSAAAKAANDKDASYDYAYYDSANDNPPEKEYSEYGFITEFGRTSASQNGK